MLRRRVGDGPRERSKVERAGSREGRRVGANDSHGRGDERGDWKGQPRRGGEGGDRTDRPRHGGERRGRKGQLVAAVRAASAVARGAGLVAAAILWTSRIHAAPAASGPPLPPAYVDLEGSPMPADPAIVRPAASAAAPGHLR